MAEYQLAEQRRGIHALTGNSALEVESRSRESTSALRLWGQKQRDDVMIGHFEHDLLEPLIDSFCELRKSC